MPRLAFLLVIVQLLGALPADATACRSNDWQPTYVHDLVNADPVPYYVMPDGTFVALTGEWASQSGPGMCCLYGVRDRRGFTNCFDYTRIQCGCDLDSLANDTCRRFLAFKGVTAAGGSASPLSYEIGGRWQTQSGGTIVEFSPEGTGTYVEPGDLRRFGFTPGEVGQRLRRVGDGVYRGQVKWRGAGGRFEWRDVDHTVRGDEMVDSFGGVWSRIRR